MSDVEYTFDPDADVAPATDVAGPEQYAYTYDKTVDVPQIQNPEGPQQDAPEYTPTGAQSLDPNNSYNQLLAGVGIAKDFNYLGDTTSRTMADITAPSSVPVAQESSWIDRLFSMAAGVKPDTWMGLAGKALEGYAQGKAAERKYELDKGALELAQKKQSVAENSAASVQRPGLIGTYKSMFTGKGQVQQPKPGLLAQ